MLRYIATPGNCTSLPTEAASVGGMGLPAVGPGELSPAPGDGQPPVTPAPINPLVARLRAIASFDSDDITELEALAHTSVLIAADRMLVEEGCRAGHISLILEGLACRFKMLPGGRRQILGYLLPGDLCDVHFTLCNRPDHSVTLLCDSRIAQLPIARVAALIARRPAIARALSLAVISEAATLREWLLNVGQRDATQKIAHFFCEMAARMRCIGRVAADGSFDLPVNQVTLGDTTGLSTVHVNRVLQRLRADRLIVLSRRRLTILAPQQLAMLAGFEENYLHLASRHA